MDWTSIFLSGLIGGCSAGIATLIVKKPKEKRGAFAGVMAVAFLILTSVSNQLVKPRVNVWRAERELLRLPPYAALAEHEPAIFEEVKRRVTTAIADGKNSSEVAAEIRPLVTEVVTRYAPKAPDDAVIEMTRVTIREVEELEQDGSDRCYRLLFPKQGGRIADSLKFSPGLQSDDLNALAEVINRGAKQPTLPMTPDVAEPLLEQIADTLLAKHGDDALVLADAENPNVDRHMVCRITASFYGLILSLPKEQSGGLLRFIYSE